MLRAEGSCSVPWAPSLSPFDLPLFSIGGLMGGDLTSGAGTSAGKCRPQWRVMGQSVGLFPRNPTALSEWGMVKQ